MSSPLRTRATLTGLLAILIWSTLAILGVIIGDMPPLQLVAMAFSAVFVMTVVIWAVRGGPGRSGSAASLAITCSISSVSRMPRPPMPI